jgi:hypothetical protein
MAAASSTAAAAAASAASGEQAAAMTQSRLLTARMRAATVRETDPLHNVVQQRSSCCTAHVEALAREHH